MEINKGKPMTISGHTVLGWTTPKQLKWYNSLVGNVRDGCIVEVGVYGGQTLLGIAETCAKNNNTVYGIDPWELIKDSNGKELNSEDLAQLRELMRGNRTHLERVLTDLGHDHITLVQGFSPGEAGRFDDQTVDLVFVDGSHSYDAVYADLGGWLPKLKKDGKICGDDFVWTSVSNAVRDFCKANDLRVRSGASVGADERCWEIVF
jgi:hypothetical protein